MSLRYRLGVTWPNKKAGGASSPDFILLVKTDNAGTSADNQFTIPTSTTGITQAFLYDIETSDGQSITGVTGNHTITFPSAGEYEVKISGSFPYIKFAGGGDRLKLLEIKNWGIYGIGSSTQNEAFENCTNLTISATDGGEGFANVANFGFNIFTGAFTGCASITNFPVINTSSGISFRGSWYNSGITSFPTLDFSNAKSFRDAWRNCSDLITFSLQDFSSVDGTGTEGNFANAWFECSSLTTIPAGLFDGVLSTNFSNTFFGTNLTTTSIDNILVSIESNGTSNGTFTQSGGQGRSYNSNAAVSSLIAKGWTLTLTTPVVSDEFAFTVKTDNAGTSADNQFTIPTTGTGFLYDITTSDGYTATGVTGNHTITFPSGAGTHTVTISGSFPQCYFNNGGDKAKLMSIENFGIYALGSTRQLSAFNGCSNMVISATDSGNFGSVTTFQSTWKGCSSLESFPLIDTSSGTDFNFAWQDCSSLISFPLIDTSNANSIGYSWWRCNALTTFPLIDTSSVTIFEGSWRACSSLTPFPLLNTSSGSTFSVAWDGCSSLDSFPANAFDTNIATNYGNAFRTTNLTTQSIDDILVSLDTSGVSNGTFTQSGGQAPSATGEAAIDSLVGKGWTITVTGGYVPAQLLLDQYPNAAAAYSLRALSTATVNSAVVRVRRSSDNVEQDFTATEITDGTLTTFTGANDGFVTIWYDQSGNNVNVVQVTATKQPQLVDNGVVILENGKPTVFYGLDTVSSAKGLATTSEYIIPQPTNYFSVARLNVDGTSFLFDRRTNGSNDRQNMLEQFGGVGVDMGAGNALTLTDFPSTKTILYEALFNSTNSKGYMDSVEMVIGDAGTSAQDWGQLGFTQGSAFQSRSISELIIYPSDQTANRAGINENLNAEYLIYGDVAVSGLLFDYPNASAAYSLRQLTFYQNGYTPNLVRVRRSSDNAEQDFIATEITDGTLATFCSSTDGFVTTWYNQSTERINDAVQATATDQPKLVSNGAVILDNGKPAVEFNGNYWLKTNYATSQPITVALVGKSTTTSVDVFYSGESSNSRVQQLNYEDQNYFSLFAGVILEGASHDNDRHLWFNLHNTANSSMAQDGVITANGNNGSNSLTGFQIGSQQNGQALLNGYIQEIILYPSNQSANRTGIETNINNEYTIY